MPDPNNALGNPQPTHINAYRDELAQAEQALAVAQGRVNSLKGQIATHPEATDEEKAAVAPEQEAPAEDNAEGSEEPAPAPKKKSLLKKAEQAVGIGKDAPAEEAAEPPAEEVAEDTTASK